MFPNVDLISRLPLTCIFSFFLFKKLKKCNKLLSLFLSFPSPSPLSPPPSSVSPLPLQELSASSHCAPVWPGSTLSCHVTPATCMDSLTTSAMAMDGPCSVHGGAWASRWSRDSSVPWPLLSNLSRGPTAPNPDPRTGQCAKTTSPYSHTHTHIYIYKYIYNIHIYDKTQSRQCQCQGRVGVGSGTHISPDSLSPHPRDGGRRSPHVAVPSICNFWLRGFLRTAWASPLEDRVPIPTTHKDGGVGALGRDGACGPGWHRCRQENAIPWADRRGHHPNPDHIAEKQRP